MAVLCYARDHRCPSCAAFTPSWLARAATGTLSEARAPVPCSMMVLSRRAVLAFAVLAPVRAAAASAAASAWVDGHRSRVRLLDAGRDGAALLAALEIELHPGFKTYWRTPGDSGVPATFDWGRSKNVAAVEPLWPAPTRFEDAGGVSYGYHDRLVLPL